MKYFLSFILILTTHSLVFAQATCEDTISKAEKQLDRSNPFANPEIAYKLLLPCAQAGHSRAEQLLGMMFLQGVGVPKDEAKAYSYTHAAAQKHNPIALFNMGVMYKTGVGRDLNPNKAIDWWTKALHNGSDRAAYGLGYMYLKGHGVAQDYDNAFYWFSQSDYPKAKYFVAVCHYFGFGTPQNKNRALELALDNPIVESAFFVAFMEQANSTNDVSDVTTQHTNTNAKKTIEGVKNNAIDPDLSTEVVLADLVGDWQGMLVKYDWAGTLAVDQVPLDWTLQITGENNMMLTPKNNLQPQTMAKWSNGVLRPDSLSVSLKKLIPEPKKEKLDYSLLALHFGKQQIGGNSYLVANVEGFIPEWQETAEPMAVVLYRADVEGSEDYAMAALEAINKQQFIQVYPVPFTDQLYIQYDLPIDAEVYVELVSVYSAQSHPIFRGFQKAGLQAQHYRVTGRLADGVYIIRVHVNGHLFTKTVLKDQNPN